MGWVQRGNKSAANLPQTLWHLLIEKWLYSASALFVFGFTFLFAVSLFFVILPLITLGRVAVPWRTAVWGAPILETSDPEGLQPTAGVHSLAGKRVWRGRSGRENFLWTDCNPSSTAPRWGGRGEAGNERVNFELWWRRVEGIVP